MLLLVSGTLRFLIIYKYHSVFIKRLVTSSEFATHMMYSLVGNGKGSGNFLSSPRCFSVCSELRREPFPIPRDPSVTSTTCRIM